MRKFFGIIASVAAALGVVACEQPATPVEKAPIVIYDGPVVLADQGFGMYYGDRDFNQVGVYSFVLSNAVCFRDGYDQPYLDSEGDMIVLELLADLQSANEAVMIPEGVYEITSASSVYPRVNTAVSYVKRLEGNIQYQYSLESGKIIVSINAAEGTYNVDTQDLILRKGSELYATEYHYTGNIKFAEWSMVAAEIQDMKADIVDMPFTVVDAAYYGNLFGYGTGNYVINLSTTGFMADETGKVPGIALCMNVFSELLTNKTNIVLGEGVYTVYPSFNSSEGSMLFGLNMDGVPFGTYLAQVDKSAAQSIEFISGGTLEITHKTVDDALVYELNYTFNAPSRKISGTWVGPVVFADYSTDADRLVLSTLDHDVECDMHRVETGYMSHVETLKTTPLPSVDIADVWQLWLEPRMWTPEEKELPWDERIAAWDPNGDVMILEFVTPFEAYGDIAPKVGEEYTYTIEPSLAMDQELYLLSVSKMGRPYDDIFYEPNWDKYTYMKEADAHARRGFTWDGGFRGNWYLHYIEGSYQNMDETAPAVKGTIKVTRNDDYLIIAGAKTATFKLEWALIDDTEAAYEINGEWEGKIEIKSNMNELPVEL